MNFPRPSNWSMLYWRRAGQRKQKRCKWRSFYENAQTHIHRARGGSQRPDACPRRGRGGDKVAEDVPHNAVALVGDQEISKEQFDALIAQAKASAQQQKRSFPKAGTPEYKNLQNQGLEYLIRRAEFEQKAKDMDV